MLTHSFLFGLDAQLLFDACISAINIFILFTGLSYLIFIPARDLLNRRKEKIENEKQTTAKNREEAIKMKTEYEARLKDINKEAETILSEGRKKALQSENTIIAEAKTEAGKIIERANNEIELEKKKVKDEVKQQMISIASLMAGKIISTSIDESTQAGLIEDTLKEMGDSTWQS